MFEIASQVAVATAAAASSGCLRHVLLVRGGSVLAATAVAAAVSNTTTTTTTTTPTQEVALTLSGGAKSEVTSAASAPSTSFLTPEGKAVVAMALGMALHYFGYSIARSVTVSLFTSESTGYAGNTAAFPFAMGFISPMSLLLLMGYTGVLERCGPRKALQQSSLFCALVMSAGGVAIASFLQTGLTVAGIPAVKLITGPLFVFRESYVQLMTSQYWSFMASTLTPNQSAKWFGPIAGLTSISSAVAGITVSPLVQRIGLSGALLATGTMLLMSLGATEMAYRIAKEHGFEPTDKKKHNKKTKSSNKLQQSELHQLGKVEKARRLFQRVPVLKALFLEILSSQGLATLLNVCFVQRLATAIPSDDERAGWLGHYYSLINVITMVLQFSILPPLMSVLEPRHLWRVIPLVSLLITSFQALQPDPSLRLVAASLLVMKVTEYSARRMLDEMIFVPLDFESRFVGKEVIGVFGYRFGKSLMSLVLSGLTALDAQLGGLRSLSILSSAVCFSWMGTAWNLSNRVPTRAQAEAAHQTAKEEQQRQEQLEQSPKWQFWRLLLPANENRADYAKR